jgi:HTH-type transcriptional regulator/antitoxin HigA
MDAEPGTPDFDELELLGTLADLYEEKHFPIDLPDPVSAIKFRMEQAGLTDRDLVPFIGSPGNVSEILDRKSPMDISMMRSLHKGSVFRQIFCSADLHLFLTVCLKSDMMSM